MSEQHTDSSGEHEPAQEPSPPSASAENAASAFEATGSYEGAAQSQRRAMRHRNSSRGVASPTTSEPGDQGSVGFSSRRSPLEPGPQPQHDGGLRPRQAGTPLIITTRFAPINDDLNTPRTANLVEVPERDAVEALLLNLANLTLSEESPERLKEVIEGTLGPALVTLREYLDSYAARQEQEARRFSSVREQLLAALDGQEALQAQKQALENDAKAMKREHDLAVTHLEQRALEAEVKVLKLTEDLNKVAGQQVAAEAKLEEVKSTEASLGKQVEQLRNEASKARYDKEHIEKRETDLEKKFDLSNKQHEDVVNGFTRRIAELEEEIASMAMWTNEQTQTLEKAVEDYNKMVSDYETVNDEYQGLQRDFQEMVNARNAALNDARDAKSRAKELKKQLDTSMTHGGPPEDKEAAGSSKQVQDVAEAHSKVKALEEQIQALQESHLKDVKRLETHVIVAKEIGERHLAYWKRLVKVERARADPPPKEFKTAAQEWKEERAAAMKMLGIADLDQKKKELQAQILDLETKVQAQVTQPSSSTQAENSNAKLKAVEKTLRKSQDELAETTRRRDELYEDFLEAERAKNEAQASNEELQEQVTEATTKARSNADSVSKLEKQLDQVLKELAKSEKDRVASGETLVRYQKRSKDLEQKVQEDAQMNILTRKEQKKYENMISKHDEYLKEQMRDIEYERQQLRESHSMNVKNAKDLRGRRAELEERSNELEKAKQELSDRQVALQQQHQQESESALKKAKEDFDSKLKGEKHDFDAKLVQRQVDFDAELKQRQDDYDAQAAQLQEQLRLHRQREQELRDHEQRLTEREAELQQREARIGLGQEVIREMRGFIRRLERRVENKEGRHLGSRLCICTLFGRAPGQSPESTRDGEEGEGDDDSDNDHDDANDTAGRIHAHGDLPLHYPTCQLATALLWYACLLVMPFTMPWRPLLIFFHLCGWTPIYVLRLLAYFFRVGAAKAYDRIRQRDPRPDPPKPAMVEISAEDIMSSLLWLSIVFVAMVSAALWMERSIWLFDNGFRVPYARELAYRFPERGWGVGSADFRLLYQPFIDYLSNGNLIALFHQLSMSTS